MLRLLAPPPTRWGVLKSTDGGINWNELAPTVKWSQFNDPISQGLYLKINQLLLTASGDLLIGTSDSPATASNIIESGIWKWDAGSNVWEKKQTTTNDMIGSSISDMLQLPNGKIIAATEHGKLYSSTDSGNTFSLINSSQIPVSGIKRVALANCPSNPNAFYVLFSDNGFRVLLKSIDIRVVCN